MPGSAGAYIYLGDILLTYYILGAIFEKKNHYGHTKEDEHKLRDTKNRFNLKAQGA